MKEKSTDSVLHCNIVHIKWSPEAVAHVQLNGHEQCRLLPR